MKARRQATSIRFATLFLLMLTVSVGYCEDELSIQTGQRFIAHGQLAHVRSGRSRERSYVLLDERGAVTASLRPAAGVNLQSHVGEEVGVTARTLVDAETPILLAENVTTFGKARMVSREDYPGRIALASHEHEIAGGQIVSESILPAPMSPGISAAPSVHDYSNAPVSPIIQGGSSVMADGNSIVADGAPIISNGVPMMSGGYLQPGYPGVSHGYGMLGDASCTGTCGNAGCKTCAACPCGLPGRYWIRAESLIWWTKGMDTPALLVSSPAGTPRQNAGVEGVSGNQTVFGGQILDESRSGVRFRLGRWCDRCNWIGFETDFFSLNDQSYDYSDCNIGPQILGRPFDDVVAGPSAELVDFPGVVAGTIHIDTETSLWSINPRMRVNLSCENFPICNPRKPYNTAGGYRLDMLVGYRFVRLEDDLSINEQLMAPTADSNGQTPLIPRFDNVTYFDMREHFSTTNDFHGADIGLSWEGYRGPWSMELMGKVGIGSTNQDVSIRGSTTRTAGGNSFTDSGALLALDSNIGSYSRNEFTVLPECSATLGYAITPRTRVLVGYTFLYWSDVVRAGEQIDTTVNTDLIPDAQPTTNPERPQFSFVDTSYWAQGLNLGLDYRW